MLPRLSSCAAPPPPPNTSTITPPAYVMTSNPARIRRGRQLGQLGQPARSAARPPAPSPAVSRQPSAVSLQPSASSRQPSSSPASSLAPHQSDEKPPPSPPIRSADFSPVRREASGHKPRSPSPHGRSCASVSPKYPPSATLKVINNYVDNLLITC